MSNYVIMCSVFDMPKYLIVPDVDQWTPNIEYAKRMTLEEATKVWESLPDNYKSYSSIWSVRQKRVTVLHEEYEGLKIQARVAELEKELAFLREKLKCQ